MKPEEDDDTAWGSKNKVLSLVFNCNWTTETLQKGAQTKAKILI
jgi:hypothetical protein